MTIQILDIKRNGIATYRANDRLHVHQMRLSTSMVREANEDFKGSLGEFDVAVVAQS